ncbi:MAG: single-stranded-DNA-specific exonuclease RecJ [Ruminococcus sp.]|jgi:single-stranded-DNA-specific exonuclease|nr:single-stranded-DNA-specific exonuclease RecJ [Ruminococcus sp.]
MDKWVIGKPDEVFAEKLAKKGSLPYIAAEVLTVRGIYDINDAAAFFGQKLSDPFLLPDMEKAAAVINRAIDEEEKICVYGDYDCDGICSAAILFRYLEAAGADVLYHINTRDEGFGLNSDVINRLYDSGVKLIVTADNGTSALKEAELAAKLGIKLVITDHHKPGENLPRAEAVVNPHRKDSKTPFIDLCGCGVVLKLIAALDGGDYSAAIEQFSDLTALATVADIVPLCGENRVIVTHGMHYMENSENVGLRALIKAADVNPPITSYKLGFMIAPRINAAGRFTAATEAADLFLSEDPEAAKEKALRLCSLNAMRKTTEAGILAECAKMINAAPKIVSGRVITLCGEDWHHGVIGIVAARLLDRFAKPCFIMSCESDDTVRGSARSFPGFPVYEALEYCSDVLLKYGGHSGAGGFSLKKENVESFGVLLEEFAKTLIEKTDYGVPETAARPVSQAIKRLMPDEINLETVKALSVLEPFGEGNPQPEFLIQGAALMSMKPSAKGVHTCAVIGYGNIHFPVMFFGKSPGQTGFTAGDKLDLLVCLEEDNRNGNVKVSVKIKSMRKSGINQSKFFAAENTFECYMRGETDENAKAVLRSGIPDRTDVAEVYKRLTETPFGIEQLYFKVAEKMNYFKFRIILEIFSEFGFIETDYFEQTVVKSHNIKKAELENSEVLKRLKTLSE